jgi:hypothetical protein
MSYSNMRLLELSKRKLVRQAKCQLRMLQHVVEAEVLNLVLGGVDLIVAVLEVRLDNERRGVSGLGSAGVVGAGVATLGQNVRDIAVHGDNLLDELGETRIDVVCDDANRLWLACINCLLNVAGHVLLEHGLDVSALLLV